MKFLFSDAAFGLFMVGAVSSVALGGVAMVVLLALSVVSP